MQPVAAMEFKMEAFQEPRGVMRVFQFVRLQNYSWVGPKQNHHSNHIFRFSQSVRLLRPPTSRWRWDCNAPTRRWTWVRSSTIPLLTHNKSASLMEQERLPFIFRAIWAAIASSSWPPVSCPCSTVSSLSPSTGSSIRCTRTSRSSPWPTLCSPRSWPSFGYPEVPPGRTGRAPWRVWPISTWRCIVRPRIVVALIIAPGSLRWILAWWVIGIWVGVNRNVETWYLLYFQLLGYLNFFLWASDLWFLYKETIWFQNRAGQQNMSQGGGNI